MDERPPLPDRPRVVRAARPYGREVLRGAALQDLPRGGALVEDQSVGADAPYVARPAGPDGSDRIALRARMEPTPALGVADIADVEDPTLRAALAHPVGPPVLG